MEMETGKKNKLSRGIQGLIRGSIMLVIALMVYVGVVLLETPEARQDDWTVLEDAGDVRPLQAAESSDPKALARLLGAPLPAFSGANVSGEARNTTHDSKTVRQITLRYNGAVITALRPASAAPLLLRDGLSVSLRSDLTAMNLPAVMAEGDGEYCLYFSGGQAAYSLYARAESAEEFLRLAEKLRAVMP